MRPHRPRRAGVSYLEIQVALVVLGIGLSGICPLVLMQLKLLKKLESPDPNATGLQVIGGLRIEDGRVFVTEGGAQPPAARVLQPRADAWVRRLGLASTIEWSVPSPPTSRPDTPSRQVVAVGDSDFSAEGWTAGLVPSTRSPGESASKPASWKFYHITPGYYRVFAHWPADSRNANEATYTLTNAVGEAPRPQNQQSAPTSSGLGDYYLNDTFQVDLDFSSASVVAGSVEIFPLNRVQIRAPVAPTTSGFGVSVDVSPRDVSP